MVANTKEYNRKYYLGHKEYFKNYAKNYEKLHPDKHKESDKRLRLEVLTHYGGNPPKCVCCGFSDIRALCLDHINGCGNIDRREVLGVRSDRRLGKERAGASFYRWLRQQKFPEGFQVLCSNCNMAKGKSKVRFCPIHHSELY